MGNDALRAANQAHKAHVEVCLTCQQGRANLGQRGKGQAGCPEGRRIFRQLQQAQASR
jgi:hypothetical protein